MNNYDVRTEMFKHNIKQWELAEQLQISEFTLCRKLRHELSKEDKEKALNGIKEIIKERKQEAILRTKAQQTIVERELILLDMKDVMYYTGWSDNVVKRLFAYDKELPVLKIGKKNQIELNAFKQYLSKRRTNKDE